MPNLLPKRLVHPSTLLQMFKDLGYESKILENKAIKGKPYKSKPAPGHQLPGAMSESVPYFLLGVKIAICHQYTNPDGTLGASKKPDPKWLSYQGFEFCCHSWNKGIPCVCVVCSSQPEDWKVVLEEQKRRSVSL